MVYSANETTCFGLYWPSSGFYNIEEESANAIKFMTKFSFNYFSGSKTLCRVQCWPRASV